MSSYSQVSPRFRKRTAETAAASATTKHVAKTYQDAITRHFYRIAARLWANLKTRAASLKELHDRKYIPIYCWNYVTFNHEFLQHQEAMQYYQIYVRPELKFTSRMRDQYERVLWKQNYICFVGKMHDDVMAEVCESAGINEDVRGLIEDFLWHPLMSRSSPNTGARLEY
jgi:hypothetical protein